MSYSYYDDHGQKIHVYQGEEGMAGADYDDDAESGVLDSHNFYTTKQKKRHLETQRTLGIKFYTEGTECF